MSQWRSEEQDAYDRREKERLRAVSSYQGDGSSYPRWSIGEQAAIQYAARDLTENFTKTDYQHRLRTLYDLMTSHDT